MAEVQSTEHEGRLEDDGRHCNSTDCWCWEDRYMIVTRETNKDLMEAVNAFIHQKGWRPVGGVSHSVAVYGTHTSTIWAQTMVRHL